MTYRTDMSQPKWITDRPSPRFQSVIVRTGHHQMPVFIGYRDKGDWCFSDGRIYDGNGVLGWMSLEDAAALLDAPSNKALAESLK